MLNLTDLEIIKPVSAVPGDFLYRGIRDDHDIGLVVGFPQDGSSFIPFGRQEYGRAFGLRVIQSTMEARIKLPQPIVLVDETSGIMNEAMPGCLFQTANGPAIAAGVGGGTKYFRLDGISIEEPDWSFFVGFSRWSLTIPLPFDRHQEVFRSWNED